MACAAHVLADTPPALITSAFHAARVEHEHAVTTITEMFEIDELPVCNDESQTVSAAFVYRELGVAAAENTEGGPEAVRKELNNYLGTKSLGRPINRTKLMKSALIYKAKLLFGQKALETKTPKAKSRLVIGGHIAFTPGGRVAIKHSKGADSKTTGDYWAPGATLGAVRQLCSYAAVNGMVLTSRDLSQAYLQTITNEAKSYIQLPLAKEVVQYLPQHVQDEVQAMRAHGVADTDIVFPVISSLYGLPSAGYSYWKALDCHLTEHGWCKVSTEGGALWCKGKNRLCCYVDDLFACTDACEYKKVWDVDILAGRWSAEDQGIEQVTRYLGVSVHRMANGGYLMEQNDYAHSIVKAYEAMTGRVIKPRKTLPPRLTHDDHSSYPDDGTLHVPDHPNIPTHYQGHMFAGTLGDHGSGQRRQGQTQGPIPLDGGSADVFGKRHPAGRHLRHPKMRGEHPRLASGRHEKTRGSVGVLTRAQTRFGVPATTRKLHDERHSSMQLFRFELHGAVITDGHSVHATMC